MPGLTPPKGLRLLFLNREAMFGLFSSFSSSSSSGSRVATVVVATSSSSLSVLLSVVDVVPVVVGVDKIPGIFPANLFLPELMPPGFRRLNSRFDFTRGPLRVTWQCVDLIRFFAIFILIFKYQCSNLKIKYFNVKYQSIFKYCYLNRVFANYQSHSHRFEGSR